MNKERITHLVQKLRNGKATPAEITELNDYWQWAQSDQSLFESISTEERELIRSSMLNEIKNRIAAREGKQRSLVFNTWTLRIAAALGVVMISFLLWNNSSDEQIQHVTAFGEQKSVTLPDGSSIRLNGNSAIKYSPEWDEDDDREIWISGEGFFDVVHTDNHQKFVVHTGQAMDVQVLGTRFNVKVRRGKAEVMLEEGRVRLSMNDNEADTLTMKPGELVVRAKQQVQKANVNATQYASWKDNKLYFSETPLIEVARILEDTYGFEVEFENKSLNNRKLSGEIRSAKGEDILTAIRESLDIKITEDGHKIVLHSK